jgi:hypothetical protein
MILFFAAVVAGAAIVLDGWFNNDFWLSLSNLHVAKK